jgi:polysaccharide chain length determinant protein (PEP-CTERM system associated)
MNTLSEFDFKRFINIFYVHKAIALTVFAVIASLTAYLAATLPNVYESRILILVSPPKLPSNYVASPVTMSTEQRLRNISSEVLSRTNLEKIVQNFNLYPAAGTVDARVDRLRKNILLDLRRSDSFSLAFEDKDPLKAMRVTEQLGAFYVSQNQELRKQQVLGTITFINSEADRLRKELEQQESAVNLYKAQHRSELPEQLDANLRTLDQLRRELEAGNLRMASLQERKASLEKQMVEVDLITSDLSLLPGTGGTPNVLANAGVDGRRRELDSLRRKYSEKHPDVVRLKREIELLEKQAPPQSATPATKTPTMPSLKDTLGNQIEDLKIEMTSLKSKNDNLRSQINDYQTRIDNTPIRAIEVSKISRAYEITLKKFQDLQAKSMESQISENAENKDNGERFQITDAANLPQTPVRPNRMRILLAGIALAIMAGLGAAFLRENLDTSFKRAEDLRANINIPVLAIIPSIRTRGNILEERRAQRVLVFAAGVIIFVGAVSIHVYSRLFY